MGDAWVCSCGHPGAAPSCIGGNSGHVRCSPRSPSGMPSRGTTNRHGPQAAGSVARSGAEQLHEPARADLAIRRAETTRVTTRDLIRAAESLSSRRGKRRRRACRGPGAGPPCPRGRVRCVDPPKCVSKHARSDRLPRYNVRERHIRTLRVSSSVVDIGHHHSRRQDAAINRAAS